MATDALTRQRAILEAKLRSRQRDAIAEVLARKPPPPRDEPPPSVRRRMAEQRSAYDRANLTDGVRKGRDHLPDPAPLALDVDVDQLEACDRMHGREDWLTQRDRLLEEFGISRKHPHGRRPGEYDSRNTYAREEARRILRFERAQKRGP